MNVTLMNYTQNAKRVLVMTKNTRLLNSVEAFRFEEASDEEIQKELDYMVNTIKSSWEFVDFTFLIENVSRGFTHQFVRNRLGSYAQQTMRMIDMHGFTYTTGPSISANTEIQAEYDIIMAEINDGYKRLIEMGAKPEDARGVLPTNIHTNIVAKFNLRALSQMMLSRASSRTQNEYRQVLDAMFEAAVAAEPWLADFLRVSKYEDLAKLESAIRDVYDGTDQYTDLIKLIDKVRNNG